MLCAFAPTDSSLSFISQALSHRDLLKEWGNAATSIPSCLRGRVCVCVCVCVCVYMNAHADVCFARLSLCIVESRS